jgi:hypothetical protein
LLLFEVGGKPPHDGMRRMERYNLWGVLAADQWRIGGPYELTPPVVPLRTFFCRSRTRYLPACNFSVVGPGNRRNRGAVLAPAELGLEVPQSLLARADEVIE